MRQARAWFTFAVALHVMATSPLLAQERIERNVVYGMHAGAAMLLDVYHPLAPNGLGVVFVPGSGWSSALDYSAPALKDSPQVGNYGPSLLAAGYTVFAVTHRAAPAYTFPAPVEDLQRAVRFIRHNASRFGVRPDWIGGYGGSSGGNLISLVGTLDGRGDPDNPDPVNTASAKLQCVVARAPQTDLIRMPGGRGRDMALYLGVNAGPGDHPSSVEYKTASAASPISHVSADDPPFLLIHGDADTNVPFEQSEMMLAALNKVGVEAKLLRIPGGNHGDAFPGAVNPPDYKAAMVEWFNQCRS
jgi:acetyl esterase/lipase